MKGRGSLLCLFLAVFILMSGMRIAQGETVEQDEDLSQFIYLQEPPEMVYPIHEYKLSIDGEKPNFLYSTDYPYPRIVEFYAPWCPHW